ncbi:MAG TPA: ABC transporter permease [Ktedonobacteraceae bacterium]|nr:ABC transporter permease [Ktedonobacteraceae bacterium]
MKLERIFDSTAFLLRYAWQTYRALFSWLTPGAYLVLKILLPLTQVIFFTLLGRFAGGDASYYLVGNATEMVVFTGIAGAMQVISNERDMGTLQYVIIAPQNNALTFYARTLFLILDGLTSIAVCFLAGLLLFHLDFSHVNWLWLSVDLLIISFSVSGLGLALGVVSLVGVDFNLLLNLALSVFLVLCGVNFPLARLPLWIQSIAQLLPLTHGLLAVRAAFAGTTTDIVSNTLAELLIGCIYIGFGSLLFYYFEYLARKKGTLSLQD